MSLVVICMQPMIKRVTQRKLTGLVFFVVVVTSQSSARKCSHEFKGCFKCFLSPRLALKDDTVSIASFGKKKLSHIDFGTEMEMRKIPSISMRK
jgi:hypothetical protein